MSDDVRADDWLKAVRRARLGRTVKGVALLVVAYADFGTGRDIHPGTARLAHEAEISPEKAGEALATLVSVGLLEKTGKHGNTDEYRLALPEMSVSGGGLIPSPAQHELAIERIRDRERGTYRKGARRILPPAEPGADVEPSGDQGESAPGSTGGRSGSGENCPPFDWGQKNGSAPALIMEFEQSAPSSDPICPQSNRGLPIDPPLEVVPTSTPHSDEDLRHGVLVPGGPGREQESDSGEDSDPPPVADLSARPRCPHGRTTRRDGNRPRCVDCRAEETAATAEPAVTSPAAAATADGIRIPSTPSKCDHGLPYGRCVFCRRESKGATAP